MFRHTYPPLAAIKTQWRCLLWPTLAGFELAHLNAATMGSWDGVHDSTSTKSAVSLSQGPAHSTPSKFVSGGGVPGCKLE